jgi:hypothetical protein
MKISPGGGGRAAVQQGDHQAPIAPRDDALELAPRGARRREHAHPRLARAARVVAERRVCGLLGVELGARGQRQAREVGDPAHVGVEPAAPETRRRAGVVHERPQALVLQRRELFARQALDGRVVEAVVRKRRHDDRAAARAPMPNTRSALPA